MDLVNLLIESEKKAASRVPKSGANQARRGRALA
jgi:hypothetical protein